MTALHLTAGYSAIDHQLDPLIEVCRQWIEDPYTPGATGDDKRATARRLAETIRAAADLVEAIGTPADPLDTYCDTCGAPPKYMCWNPRTYADNKNPHPARLAAVRGLTKEDVS